MIRSDAEIPDQSGLHLQRGHSQAGALVPGECPASGEAKPSSITPRLHIQSAETLEHLSQDSGTTQPRPKRKASTETSQASTLGRPLRSVRHAIHGAGPRTAIRVALVTSCLPWCRRRPDPPCCWPDEQPVQPSVVTRHRSAARCPPGRPTRPTTERSPCDDQADRRHRRRDRRRHPPRHPRRRCHRPCRRAARPDLGERRRGRLPSAVRLCPSAGAWSALLGGGRGRELRRRPDGLPPGERRAGGRGRPTQAAAAAHWGQERRPGRRPRRAGGACPRSSPGTASSWRPGGAAGAAGHPPQRLRRPRSAPPTSSRR